MHAHALAPRDKTTDQVRRGWLAALGQLGHQRVNAHHQHAALGCGIVGACFLEQQIVVGLQNRLGRSQHRFDVAQREFILAHHFEQGIGGLEAQLHRQIVELDGSLALALQQLFDRLAPTGHGFVCGLGVEPGSHLGFGAVAGEVAQLSIEPVA
ncbi:hypothetical protein D3C72_1776750 [compost metagenome]